MITIVSKTRKTAAVIAPIFHESRPNSLVSKQIHEGRERAKKGEQKWRDVLELGVKIH